MAWLNIKTKPKMPHSAAGWVIGLGLFTGPLRTKSLVTTPGFSPRSSPFLRFRGQNDLKSRYVEN